ncbi:MAG TPA: FAD-containing oxidoreductase [Rudaea sp.]|jgi:pyruvate/2-oxoglutarate dehydrogenase complex dihydrolipoamide dehydrogenase (E3) component|nr:FAD-containing oxidoreductase [Rudaea sp.]
MSANHFDAIILGAGQAGPPLAVALANAGQNVALVERKYFGGTCVNTGCIPTKTLIASARVAHMARRGADYGVSTGDIRVDMKKVKARKDGVSGESRTSVEKWLRDTKGCTVMTGQARFVDDHTIDVDGARYSADRFFINVGGRASIPDIAGIDSVPYLTNSTMMDVDFLPEHLVIVGGSYIGIEFAQMYRRFGSRVTILQRGSRLISREDDDVSQAMLDLLRSEDIDVRLNADDIAVEKRNDGVRVRLGADAIDASHLLVAAGRAPNTDDLGLENTSVKRDDKGFITVDDVLRTTAPNMWAMGDCNGRGAFTHTSYNDYEIVAANVLGTESRRVTDRIVTYAVFTDPPLARVGMTATEIRKSGKRALVGTRPMTRVGRAHERGETFGFLKVFVDADTKLILGACFFGVEADEAIHCIIDTMYAQRPYTTITHAVHIHPTVSELIPTVLEDLKPLEG